MDGVEVEVEAKFDFNTSGLLKFGRDPLLSESRDSGSSDKGGKEANREPFRYSLPNGLSSACIYDIVKPCKYRSI
jgi:hypothetical protein